MLDLSVIAIQNLIQIMLLLNSQLRKILLLGISIRSKPHLIILIEYKCFHLLSLVNYKIFIKVLLSNKVLILMRKTKDVFYSWTIQKIRIRSILKIIKGILQIILRPKRQRQLIFVPVWQLLAYRNLPCMIKW